MLDSNQLSQPITNKTEIERLIPQKPPIVMVDSLLFFSDEKVVSGLTITAENIFTKQHQLTESGLIENMAQTVALHTGYQFFIKNKPAPVGYIGAIKKTVIHQLPKVNDSIITTATILHEIMGVTLVKIKVVLNEQEIAEAEMKTVIKA